MHEATTIIAARTAFLLIRLSSGRQRWCVANTRTPGEPRRDPSFYSELLRKTCLRLRHGRGSEGYPSDRNYCISDENLRHTTSDSASEFIKTRHLEPGLTPYFPGFR